MCHAEWDEGTTGCLNDEDPLQVTSSRLPAAVVVAAAGEIDMFTSERFGAAVEAALTSHAGTVVIDLTEVAFLGSPGLSVLIQAQHTASESGQLLRVVAGEHGVVGRSLEISGLAERLTVCGDLEAALRAT